MLLIYGDEISYPFIIGIISQAMKYGSLCNNQDFFMECQTGFERCSSEK